MLAIFLSIGAILMCFLIALQMKWYSVSTWKCIIVSVSLVIVGVLGSQLWYFVENLKWGGRSFFGAVFFAPIVFFPVAKIFRIPYLYSLDFCAPAGCLTLAMVKIQCLRDGCCAGKILYQNKDYIFIRFPSQLVEMVVFLVLAVVLIYLSSKEKNRKTIFPWFFVLYGSSRFVLDFCREHTGSFALGLSAGSFWSLIAVAIGLVWLIIWKKRKNILSDHPVKG